MLGCASPPMEEEAELVRHRGKTAKTYKIRTKVDLQTRVYPLSLEKCPGKKLQVTFSSFSKTSPLPLHPIN